MHIPEHIVKGNIRIFLWQLFQKKSDTNHLKHSWMINFGIYLLTGSSSLSSRNRLLTDTSASSGHSWNQSILVQLTTAGNFLLLTRSAFPTGEKHNTTCRQRVAFRLNTSWYDDTHEPEVNLTTKSDQKFVLPSLQLRLYRLVLLYP